MRKGKRLYTRKNRAIRAAAAALLLLLFCNGVLHIGYLLPIQAARLGEERAGVFERTRVVLARFCSVAHLVDRCYLTEGGSSLTLCWTHPAFYGWDGSFAFPLDTSAGGSIQAGVVGMVGMDRESRLVFYGRVKGTGLQGLTANVKVWKSGLRGAGDVHLYGHGVGPEHRAERDGCTYFVFVEPYPVPEEQRVMPWDCQVVADYGGGRAEDFDCGPSAWVSWG